MQDDIKDLTTASTQKKSIGAKVKDMLTPFNTEIGLRNEYISKRDGIIFGEELKRKMTAAPGADRTLYNWCERVVNIHVSQLMGRGFQIYSSYNKRDLSLANDLNDPEQAKQDFMMNKRLKINADNRTDLIQGIIRDNGGMQIFQDGAQTGSAFGFTVFKSWPGDKDEVNDNKDIGWHIETLENLTNYWAIWASDNFREKDGDVYMYQISPDSALRKFGMYLDPGEHFETSPVNYPLGHPTNTAIPIPEQGTRNMVTVIEFTGYIPGVCGEDGDLYECPLGDETLLNLLIVGGKTVRIVTDEDDCPRYYLVPNHKVTGRPYGRADVTDTCLEINLTYLERMSDWITIMNKVLFPKYEGRGFDVASVPKPVPRTVEVLPMDSEQSIKLIDTPHEFGFEVPKLLDNLKEDFVRSAGISRVLFDDPQLAANSNQALTTIMKGMIDTVERKQQIWDQALAEMFDHALRVLGRKYPKTFGDYVDEAEDWNLYVRWPSVLRKEDPTYQNNLINRFNTGTISVETFLEKQGEQDTGEEVDRIRDNMKDPLTAAILGRALPRLAQQLIDPPPPPADQKPQVKHTVNWRADMTPQQEGNAATELGFQDGPFPPSIGPQGNQGLAAQETQANKGFIEGNPYKGGTPIFYGPNGEILVSASQKGGTPPAGAPAPGGPAPAPGVTPDGSAAPSVITPPDANQPGQQPVSQPGSGQAPPTTPAGAVKKANQNRGA